jgi:predicted MPP superfamily phosphohydrolase
MKKERKILPQKTAPHLPSGQISVFIAVISVLQLIFFLLHFMIYETLIAAFGVGIGGWWLGVLFFVLSISLVTTSILAAISKHPLVQAYYKITGVWFSFVAPLCGACFGFVIIECILPFAGIVVAPIVAGFICFGAAAAVTLYGIWNSTRAQITRVSVSLKNLPEFWHGKKIVFFSDLHLGALWGVGFAKKVVWKISALKPEVVFMGGDLFDGVKCDTDALLAPFKELRPPLGIFYVTGNHEYIRESDVFLDAIRRSNFKMLVNEKIDLRGIQLLGVDYKDTEHEEEFASALGKLEIKKDAPSILLKHVPNHLEVAERAGVSLNLSGHTHRGQFWPLSLITSRIFKGFDYGLKKWDEMAVYTSSGVGTWMSPFRFGTKSEIVEIELI